MRRIIVPPGIGDNIWLLQKLINSGERFNFVLSNSGPRRGKQIFDLLPQVVNSAEYPLGIKIGYNTIAKNNIQNRYKKFKDISEREFYLTANKHLEQGNRIENFLPDLGTSFKINWDTEKFATEVKSLLVSDKKYIGIYGSCYSAARSWGFWNEYKWFELINRINQYNPDFIFVIIGADYDLDLGYQLIKLLEKNNINFINTIGKSLDYVIEIMKRLSYFFSFPSGLGILAPTVSCPVTMFYPPHLVNLMNTWADPMDIETGAYKGCAFCEPIEILDWCIKNKKI